MTEDLSKFNAAQAALEYVKDGMVVGLGTGSTSAHFVRQLGERVRQGLRVKGVPTSEATRNLAEQVGVPLLEISQVTAIDLDVDGADEVDSAFRLIKGGGGALLREKIVAAASKRMVVIADESKWVETLGAFPLPVEVTRFGFALTQTRVGEALRTSGCAGGEVVLRISGKANEPVITDGGNYILDAHAERIPDPEALAVALKNIAGVVEHGLFIGLSQVVILGKAKGADVKQI
ncbi:ribose-5-phosphate isomerase RpiA [Terricaulis silvestris]|uniref:Ribose-5-phosphate isomerase A n=1 Tax=Terricaulis silvestris TaxID=2686094 RepID=A0A6I6MI53_9CAUL|nr:ribose-5-phosphate isomerase RpiA [Terricaulis silvestris]QGZ94690.1 Ribose-5-phosphate isomerase A [Terricaulis silvestris]